MIHDRYFTNLSFNLFMPISVLYFLIAHLVFLLLKPFPTLRLHEEQLREEYCFSTDISSCINNIDSRVDKNQRNVAIVTGSNTGIGKETALSLVERGYDAILACRSREKGEQAAQEINLKVQQGKSITSSVLTRTQSSRFGSAMFIHPLDLSSFESVRSFVKSFQGKYSVLNILVNNAGINSTGKSNNGMDLCFQTNFVSHFLLTSLLIPNLLKARNVYRFQKRNDAILTSETDKFEAGRIVNVSSVTHHFSPVDHKNGTNDQTRAGNSGMHDEFWWKECMKPGVSNNTYKESKLAAIVFTYELNKRLAQHGIKAISVNPGAVNSEIWRNFPSFLLKYILRPAFRLFYLNSKQGSRTSIVAAVAKIPQGVIYLQPYWQPSSKNKLKSELQPNQCSFNRWYNEPFPLFEMIGPYIGHAITDPRLPRDIEISSLALWNACEKVTGLSQ